MIMLSLFGLAFGWTIILVGNELEALANNLSEHRLGMAFGGVIHAVSLGMLSVAGVETGEAARSLLKAMPNPGFLIIVGWIRIALSVTAITIGFCLIRRNHWAVMAGAIWSIFSIAWFVLATLISWGFLSESLGHPLTGDNTPLYVVDGLVHLAWPLLLFCYLLPSWIRGKDRRWSAKL